MSKNCIFIPNILRSKAYLKGRFISEGGHLISDIFDVSELLKMKEILLTVDTEKAFNFKNYNFFKKKYWKSIALVKTS